MIKAVGITRGVHAVTSTIPACPCLEFTLARACRRRNGWEIPLHSNRECACWDQCCIREASTLGSVRLHGMCLLPFAAPLSPRTVNVQFLLSDRYLWVPSALVLFLNNILNMPGADDGLETSDRNLSTDTLRPRHVVYASSQPSSSSTLSVDNTMHGRTSTRFSAALRDPFSDTTPYADSDRNDVYKSAKTNDADSKDDFDPYSEYKGYNYTPGYTVVPHADVAPSYSTPNPDLRTDSFWSSISFFPRTPISASTPPGTNRHNQFTKLKRRLHIFSSYEPPPFQHLLLHTVLCAFAYPWLYLTCLAASGRTVFLTRGVAGIGYGTIGFILGLSLLQFARRQMWACSECFVT